VNIGGWGNTQDAIESGGTLDSKPGNIETGRWYDIKVAVAGKHVKCWLDSQLIHDVDLDGGGKVNAIYATAATDAQTGDLIVKVVNTQTEPLNTELNLTGAKLTGKGTAVVLTSERRRMKFPGRADKSFAEDGRREFQRNHAHARVPRKFLHRAAAENEIIRMRFLSRANLNQPERSAPVLGRSNVVISRAHGKSKSCFMRMSQRRGRAHSASLAACSRACSSAFRQRWLNRLHESAARPSRSSLRRCGCSTGRSAPRCCGTKNIC